ncbi:MAG: type 1 glutamine amidotransferase [Planctomycetota bacterium]|nr:type 1 glutamine amidotransferase [Planctomycetota bacterium]
MSTAPMLLVDCYLDDFGCPADFVPPAIDHLRVRPGHEELDAVPTSAAPYSGIVISGSAASVLEERPWSLRLEQLVRDARDRGVPLFGVCFGHQLIAKALFDAARPAPTPEVGWYEVQLRQGAAARLPGEAPETFTCFLSHFDEAFDPGHPDFVVLASSERCEVQAFRVRGAPIWGVQFHAEMDPVEANGLFDLRVAKGLELGIIDEGMRDLATYDAALWRGLYDGFLARLSAGTGARP